MTKTELACSICISLGFYATKTFVCEPTCCLVVTPSYECSTHTTQDAIVTCAPQNTWFSTIQSSCAPWLRPCSLLIPFPMAIRTFALFSKAGQLSSGGQFGALFPMLFLAIQWGIRIVVAVKGTLPLLLHISYGIFLVGFKILACRGPAFLCRACLPV